MQTETNGSLKHDNLQVFQLSSRRKNRSQTSNSGGKPDKFQAEVHAERFR